MRCIQRDMPVRMRKHIDGAALGAIPLRVGDATAHALALADLLRPTFRAPGWGLLSISAARRLADQCRRASQPDRRDPWPNGYRTALRRFAIQIETRLLGVKS